MRHFCWTDADAQYGTREYYMVINLDGMFWNAVSVQKRHPKYFPPEQHIDAHSGIFYFESCELVISGFCETFADTVPEEELEAFLEKYGFREEYEKWRSL